ncbi:MAG: lipid II flippase Amj family protein [Candidatus Margulisiibacteriota bacterium]
MSVLIFVCILTGVIHFSETLASSMRLAGVRTKQVATSLAFINTAFLVSRMSNMLQAPMLGGMVDNAIRLNSPDVLASNFRVVIFAAFIGNVCGALLIPYFVYLFEKAIYTFERVGSIPRLLVEALKPRNMKKIIKAFRLPSAGSFKDLSLGKMSPVFLWLNFFMVSIYAIGVLSSLYAGAQVPEFRTTASQLSGIVNGLATVLLALMVDPTCAFITDQAVRGRRKEGDVRAMVFYIILGRIVGTLILSQFLFWPASEYIKDATLFVKSMFVR